jgi:hypothetical protein
MINTQKGVLDWFFKGHRSTFPRLDIHHDTEGNYDEIATHIAALQRNIQPRRHLNVNF